MAVVAEQEVSKRGLAHSGENGGEAFGLGSCSLPAHGCGLAHEDCAEGLASAGEVEEVSWVEEAEYLG